MLESSSKQVDKLLNSRRNNHTRIIDLPSMPGSVKEEGFAEFLQISQITLWNKKKTAFILG